MKTLVKNERGGVTLVSLLLFVVLFSWSILAIFEARETHRQIKVRAKTYLCFKYLTHQTEAYIDRMSSYNIKIEAIYPISLIPVPPGPAAKAAWQALIAGQTMTHVSYLKNMFSNHYCSAREGAIFAIQAPYNTVRRFDGTVGLGRKQWTVYLPSTSNMLTREKGHFVLRGSYSLSSAFSPAFSLVNQELPLQALPNLKQFFGSQFSSSLP